jgi:hypothetical protein
MGEGFRDRSWSDLRFALVARTRRTQGRSFRTPGYREGLSDSNSKSRRGGWSVGLRFQEWSELMVPLVRLWEIISGNPHLHKNAKMVNAATNSLTKKTEEFESVIKPYNEAEDPLVMFMTDVFNRRSARAGNGNATPKLHP